MNVEFRRRLLFRVRRHYLPLTLSRVRIAWWRMLGMRIGARVRLHDLRVTWPHRVVLGAGCSLEHSIYFNCAGGYRRDPGVVLGEGCFIGSGCEFNVTSQVRVGAMCLIASGTRFIDHNHGTAVDQPMKLQPELEEPIVVGSNVWIGVNCVILKGVTIGDNAIIAAGSVVTRPVPADSVYGGVPARLLRMRQDTGTPAVTTTTPTGTTP